jgi:hypothetical protein
MLIIIDFFSCEMQILCGINVNGARWPDLGATTQILDGKINVEVALARTVSVVPI